MVCLSVCFPSVLVVAKTRSDQEVRICRSHICLFSTQSDPRQNSKHRRSIYQHSYWHSSAFSQRLNRELILYDPYRAFICKYTHVEWGPSAPGGNIKCKYYIAPVFLPSIPLPFPDSYLPRVFLYPSLRMSLPYFLALRLSSAIYGGWNSRKESEGKCWSMMKAFFLQHI